MGFVWSVPVPSEENDRVKTHKGGGEPIIGGGGVQNRFWEGILRHVSRGFMVCFRRP